MKNKIYVKLCTWEMRLIWSGMVAVTLCGVDAYVLSRNTAEIGTRSPGERAEGLLGNTVPFTEI